MFRDGLRDKRVWVKRIRPDPGPSVPKTKVYETVSRGMVVALVLVLDGALVRPVSGLPLP